MGNREKLIKELNDMHKGKLIPINIYCIIKTDEGGCGRKPGLKIRVRRRYSHVFI